MIDISKFLRKLGVDTVDLSFYSKIDEWDSWYKSDVAKFHDYRIYRGNGTHVKCRRLSLGMAKTVCEDMANFLLNEQVRYTFEGDANYDLVKSVLDSENWGVLGNEYQERKAALGTVAYVPYVTDLEVDEEGNVIPGTGRIRMDYVTAPDIYPISWSNGRITECAFAFHKTYKRKSYVHLQLHLIPGDQYVIENYVVKTSGSLSEVDPTDWREIPAFANLARRVETGSDKPQFVIDKLNLVNNADDNDNPMGISIFANAEDILRKIDTEYDSYNNEFKLGRKRIFVAPEMMSMKDGQLAFDPNDSVFYELPEEYLKDTHEAIHESNMALRVTEHKTAINDDLNYLSMKCGFGQEHYKFDGGQVKTATEVISENSDLYRTIKKHELVLEDVLDGLFRIILRLGVVIGVPGINPDCDITIDFDDSIIQDKQAVLDQMRTDAMSFPDVPEFKIRYVMERLGCNRDDAVKYIEQAAPEIDEEED